MGLVVTRRTFVIVKKFVTDLLSFTPFMSRITDAADINAANGLKSKPGLKKFFSSFSIMCKSSLIHLTILSKISAMAKSKTFLLSLP